MKIAEIFYSLQGEGALTGTPSAFIRTSGCNLRCVWCDTKYASWQPEGDDMDVKAVMDALAGMPTKFVVLTGGEPTIVDGIEVLGRALHAEGYHVTLETNATRFVPGLPVSLVSMSPKLSNSCADAALQPREAAMQAKERRWKPDVIDAWRNRGDYQLKFVVSGPDDIDEIEELLGMLEKPVSPEKVMLMPEGVDPDTLADRREFLVDACRRKGYRYCHRLHIDLFGNTRGT